MASTSSILAQIRQHESGAYANPYGLTPQQNVDYPRSHASGAYQFQPATWQGYTAQSGIGTQYREAYQAPPQVQDAVAAWVVQNKGTGDWAPYSGPLPANTNNDVNPYQLASSSSGLGDGGSTASTNINPETGQPYTEAQSVGDLADPNARVTISAPPSQEIDPMTGAPLGNPGDQTQAPNDVTLGPGTVTADPSTDTATMPVAPQNLIGGTGQALAQIGAYLGNYAIRVLLIILGIGMLLVAAYAFVSGESTGQTATRGARAAKRLLPVAEA